MYIVNILLYLECMFFDRYSYCYRLVDYIDFLFSVFDIDID